MQKDYLIAGLHVKMDTFGRTLIQAEPYLADIQGEPDIEIKSNAQSFFATHKHLSLEDCEYLCTGASFYRQLLSFDGFMLHASAVVMDGFAYLFSAPSGTGKSTHTKFWQTVFGKERVEILNDDKPAIRKSDGAWYAYGTPWSGKTDKNKNIKVPLGGICVLTRGNTNEIEQFFGKKAIFSLLNQTVRSKEGQSRERLLELLDDLMSSVAIWHMKCTPSEEAAYVSHAAMSDRAKKDNTQKGI